VKMQKILANNQSSGFSRNGYSQVPA